MIKAIAISLAFILGTQDPPPAQPEDRVADIVVDGRRMQELTRDFARVVVAPPPNRGVARWRSGVCIGVVNLDFEAARYMADRISDIAAATGLQALPEGCSPNIVVIWTDDATGLATALAEESPLAFRPRYADERVRPRPAQPQTRAALRRFTTTERPVRWWHVSVPARRDGALPPGLLHTSTRYDLRRAFIIVDVTRTGDATLGQITDYVAMVALAQIDPEADLSAYPTILNLFRPVAVADGLTDWDQSWLTALYGAELSRRNPRAQASSVGAAMYHDDWREGVRTEEAENAENE